MSRGGRIGVNSRTFRFGEFSSTSTYTHAGLLCFSGLLVLGISTLIFNHTVVQTRTTSTTWSQPFPGDRIAKIDSKSIEESRAIREQNNRRILHTLGSFAVATAEP